MQPGVTTSGVAIAPGVRVRILDASGAVVAGATNSVTIAIASASGAAGATLGGTLTVAAVNGVATFSDLTIDKASASYRLTATASGLSSAISSVFEILPGAAAKLAFTTQPSTVASGASIAPAVQVAVQDAAGNTVTSSTASVTLALSGGAAGAALTGTATTAAVGGVATFSNLKVDKVGTGYQLGATAAGLTAAASNAFAVTVGAPAKIQLSTVAASVGGGQAIPLTATILDAGNNVVTTATNPVTVAIASGTGTVGATLGGTLTVNAVAGVATFTGLTIDKAGTGYALTVTSSGLTSATTSAFNVTVGPAVALRFTSQPLNVAVGAGANIVVAVVDLGGNTVTTATNSITLAIAAGTGASGAVLGGTLSQAAVAGVASFPNITVDRAGTAYRLAATATGLTTATSNTFDVTTAPATQLAFVTVPSQLTVLQASTFTVAVKDASGATVTSATNAVTIAIKPGTGAAGAVLGGTLTVNAVNGVATFSNVTVDRAGTAFQLTATSGTLTAAQSTTFDAVPAGVAHLEYTVQPASSIAGVAISPAIQVTLRNAAGAVATTSTAPVTLAILSGTGTAGASITGTTTATPVNGVATFSAVNIQTAGSGYQLVATATGFAAATSSAFNITAASGARITWTTEPSAMTSGQATTFVAKIVDAFGNVAGTATNAVTTAIISGTGTAGATLGGTTNVAAVNGVATFSTLTIDKAGSGYRLIATSTGLGPDTTVAITVSAGPAAKVIFTAQPTNVNVGSAITPAMQVTVEDAAGNAATTSTAAVTLAISSGTGAAGAVVGGTVTRNAVAGVATFDNITVDRSGAGYRFTATATGLTAGQSGAFDVVATPSASFTAQPTNVVAGAAISPAIQVTLRDATGAVATSSSAAVTLAIASGTGSAGATLTGLMTVNAVNGVATFSNISIAKAGAAYQLVATATGFASATSSAFTVTPGAAAQVGILQAPSTMTSGVASTFRIILMDIWGNTATAATNNVTLAITSGTGTAGATLGGTLTSAAVAGIATFSSITIDKAGTGYTITATSAGLTSVTTSAISVTAGAATQLVFTSQPSTANIGAAISPAFQVSIRDAAGNLVTTATNAVTLAITSGSGAAGAVIGGTTTRSAVAGVATFDNVTIDRAGTGYTFTASATGLTTAQSNAFAIAAQQSLAFSVQPTSISAGAAVNPAVQVSLRDGLGNLKSSATDAVTLVISAGSGTAGATILGTATVNAVGGIATFSNVSIDRAGTGYQLAASSTGYVGATSSAFTVTAGAPASMVITQSPSSMTSGQAATVQVTLRDAFNNTATGATNAVTLAIATGTGVSGAVLGGTRTVNAVGGVATFSTITLDKAGSGYQLVATASGLGSATTPGITVTAGAPAQLVFLTQPSTANIGAVISPAMQVGVQDAAGNAVTTATNAVTLSIAAGTGTAGAVVGGTTTRSAVAGVATFDNITIDRSGNGFRFSAGGTGLTSVQSNLFAIAAPQSLSFTVQPTSIAAGAAVSPAIQVSLIDGLGNVKTGATDAVTLSILAGTGTGGASIVGTATVNAVAGVATFSNVSIDRVGTGYRLAASATGYTGASSSTFSVTPGAPAALVVSQAPTTMTSGQAATVQVTVRDAFGNTVTGATNAISLAIAAGTGVGGASLGGTTTVNAVGGTATFNTITLDKAGTGYQLTATSSGLSSATSGNIAVVPGAAAKVAFSVQPSTVTSMQNISPAVQVAIQDAAGNILSSATNSVTLSITGGTGTSGATLGGTVTLNAASGVAFFSNLTIDKAGTGYQLSASATGLTGATSTAFNVVPGAPVGMSFVTSPTTMTSGQASTFAVRIVDAGGNTVTTGTNSVTLAILGGSGVAGAVLGGTTTVAASAGVATFNTLTLDKAGAGYQLRATAAGLPAVNSGVFTVVPGAPVELRFGTQPVSVNTNTIITPAVTVALYDAAGNFASNASSSVTVAITGGTGAVGAVLAGTTTVAAVNGVAEFSTLAIDAAERNYTLTATAAGMTSAISTTFNIGIAIDIGVAHLTITPSSGSLHVGNTLALQAKQVNADGSQVSITPLWATSNPGIATVDANGVVTALAAGTVTITATKNGLAAHVTITITP